MVGYRNLPTSDPVEANLRKNCHEAHDAEARRRADVALSKYLWDRAEKTVAAGRAKHPRAKRNQVHEGPKGEGRLLP